MGTGVLELVGTYNIQFTGGGAYADCGGRCLSGSAPGTSRVGAGSSPVAISRRVRPPIDPFEYRWRRALLQVCGATIRFLFGWRGYLDKNRRDLHPIRRYRRWRELMYGWVVPMMPTREVGGWVGGGGMGGCELD